MEASKIKELLGVEDIVRLVVDGLGSQDNRWDATGAPIFQTVCHNEPGEGSYKLYYYPETQLFHCYTQCNDSFDVFELVQRAKGYDNFIDAVRYIENFFGLQETNFTFNTPNCNTELTSDWDILNKVDYYHNTTSSIDIKLSTLNENILEYFGPLAYPSEWQKDYINAETCQKFGIRIDSANSKIIIPHHDIHGNLVGIRGRSFDPIEVSEGKKYMPIYYNGECCKHPLGSCLYGLYENLEAIKQHKKVMLVESEKSVMQCYGYYKDNCFTVATCGSSLSATQIDLLLHLGVEEVILAYDRENDLDPLSQQTKDYEAKLLKVVQPLTPYMKVYVIFDYEGVLPYKASPTDLGQETLEQLMKKKQYIGSITHEIKQKRK